MKRRTILWITLVPAAVLLVPAAAMQVTDEVAWGWGDFVLAWCLMAGTGLAYALVAGPTGNRAYRGGVAVALGSAFALIWGNLAVGLIGSEDNPANLLYGGVILVGLIGSAWARLQPEAMARAMAATAVTQFLVPVVALVIWRPAMSGALAAVFAPNLGFVLAFAVAALLFRAAATKTHGPRAQAAQ